MGKTALLIKVANERIANAVQEIITQGSVITKLQASCDHDWRFKSQKNACHEHLWDVTYRCRECELTAVERKPPVCEKCLCKLARAKKSDRQATEEAKRQGPDELLGNPPLAFRCPECKKIHILWHDGD